MDHSIGGHGGHSQERSMTGPLPKDASTAQSNSGLKAYDEGKQNGQQPVLAISSHPSSFFTLDTSLTFGPKVYINSCMACI
jgi:hypothetical protein